jgi:hypothetical protein
MELPDLPKAKNRMQHIQGNALRRLGRDSNIRKRKWQTNGKTDGLGARKILDDTMTKEHGKWTPKV